MGDMIANLPNELKEYLSEIIILIIAAIFRFFERRKLKQSFEQEIRQIKSNGTIKGF